MGGIRRLAHRKVSGDGRCFFRLMDKSHVGYVESTLVYGEVTLPYLLAEMRPEFFVFREKKKKKLKAQSIR